MLPKFMKAINNCPRDRNTIVIKTGKLNLLAFGAVASASAANVANTFVQFCSVVVSPV